MSKELMSQLYDSGVKWITRGFTSEFFTLYVSLTYFCVFWFISPNIASWYNLGNLISNLLPLFVLAIGQTVVMITAGIDLSITSAVSLASVVGTMMMTSGAAPEFLITPAGVVMMIGVGLMVGMLNGAAVVWLEMPPFIVTLTTMIFARGLAIWITQSQNIFNLPSVFNSLDAYALPVTVIVFAVSAVLLKKSLLGRWIYAIGHNSKAALISGVNVNRTLLFAYAFSGLCAGVAAVLYTARIETGSPTMGDKILLDVIGATVIGGTSLFGGKGKMLWTLYGVLFITLLDNTLNMYGLPFSIIIIAKGAVILSAALLDAFRNKMLVFS